MAEDNNGLVDHPTEQPSRLRVFHKLAVTAASTLCIVIADPGVTQPPPTYKHSYQSGCVNASQKSQQKKSTSRYITWDDLLHCSV